MYLDLHIFLNNKLWTGWKPRFHRFFEDFRGRKYALIVCADFPSLDRPCLYDLSYGRCVDPNTKPFSTAYNDAVDIANKNRLTFLSLTYATILENVLLQPEINHGCA